MRRAGGRDVDHKFGRNGAEADDHRLGNLPPEVFVGLRGDGADLDGGAEGRKRFALGDTGAIGDEPDDFGSSGGVLNPGLENLGADDDGDDDNDNDDNDNNDNDDE